MNPSARNTTCTVIPSLRYRDAPAMIDWLCRAFGFEKLAVYTDDHGGVQHAQLSFGNGMVMLGSKDSNTAWGKRFVPPTEINGCVTHAVYLIVADCAAHHARAKAAGAEIVEAPDAREYGGSGYSARDPEGYFWSFGDYDPWAEHAT